MKRYLLAVITVLTVSSQANAFFIEPFLGYGISGKASGDWGSDDVKGMDYGARLGMSFAMFGVGVEYAKGQYEADTSGSEKFDTTDIGATFIFEFPILIRAYATYFFKSEADDFSGKGGYRVGVGYTGLPFVAINIEMVKRAYEEVDVAILGTMDSDSDFTMTQIGISVPLP